jgi:hypothetical protein
MLLFVVGLVVLLSFAIVLIWGAPYLPSLKGTRRDALKLLDLKKGQLLIDLGSGDGSLLIEAARSGLRAEGYEINPFLFVISWIRTRRYKKLVKVYLKNFWQADITRADGIYVFLLDKFMPRLDQKISGQFKGSLRLVSFTFKIPDKIALSEQNGLYLYGYSLKKPVN